MDKFLKLQGNVDSKYETKKYNLDCKEFQKSCVPLILF